MVSADPADLLGCSPDYMLRNESLHFLFAARQKRSEFHQLPQIRMADSTAMEVQNKARGPCHICGKVLQAKYLRNNNNF